MARFQLKDGVNRAVTHAFGSTDELVIEGDEVLEVEEPGEVEALRAHPAVEELEGEAE